MARQKSRLAVLLVHNKVMHGNSLRSSRAGNVIPKLNSFRTPAKQPLLWRGFFFKYDENEVQSARVFPHLSRLRSVSRGTERRDVRYPKNNRSACISSTSKAGSFQDENSLTFTYKRYIFIHMKTTLNIDDGLLEKAAELTGVREKTTLVRLGLKALVASESAKRLARLGGTEKGLQPIPRRRS